MRQSLESLKVSGALDYLDRLSDDMAELERPILLHDRPFLLRLTDLSTQALELQIVMALHADDRIHLTKVYEPYRTFACYYTYMKMYT